MPATPAAACRTFPVGRYRCTVTIPRPAPGSVCMMAVEWSPAMPTRLRKHEMRQYRAGRDACVAEAAAALGGPALVVEV